MPFWQCFWTGSSSFWLGSRFGTLNRGSNFLGLWASRIESETDSEPVRNISVTDNVFWSKLCICFVRYTILILAARNYCTRRQAKDKHCRGKYEGAPKNTCHLLILAKTFKCSRRAERWIDRQQRNDLCIFVVLCRRQKWSQILFGQFLATTVTFHFFLTCLDFICSLCLILCFLLRAIPVFRVVITPWLPSSWPIRFCIFLANNILTCWQK